MTRFWTDKRTEKLKELISDPRKLTATDIANEIGDGVSRNGVIGKISRLNLALPRAGDKSHPVHHKTRSKIEYIAAQRAAGSVHEINQVRSAQRAIKPEPFICQDAADIVSLNLTILELTDQACKFPTSDSPYLFCGHESTPDSSYCRSHRALCWAGRPIKPAIKDALYHAERAA